MIELGTLTEQIHDCISNLCHLRETNIKWRSRLVEIDKTSRPIGFETCMEGIRQQEAAYEREGQHLLKLYVDNWFQSLGELDQQSANYMKDTLKYATDLVKQRLKKLEISEDDSSLFGAE